MIGKNISHYRIIDKLGEGGMGEVYLAHDTDLDRKVALKFLPIQYTKDKEINKRFKREAKAAAKLNHPNIITVYEIGEFEGHAFIVMEYVEGVSLREKMRPSEPDNYQLTIKEIIHIATQICEGLLAAHQAGIVHRDIKPENILIDKSDRVKIADFGLARMKGVTKLTKDASTLGTLKYMSPEQYKNKEVDHRTDIWSFGVVLFEMLTGQVPFQGEYEAAVMYSVVNEDPVSVSTIREESLQNLERIVSKSLEKDPTMRYQSMQEVLEALKKPVSSIAVSEKKEKSVIVLPFDDMSPNRDNEYFSDGLTEEIITDLSQIHDLLVISRSSAMTFKGTKMKIKEIAGEVNVQYVLEGSVRKAGNNLRITAQLIDASKDTHLWAEKFNGILDDVFDIQEKVSLRIVEALKLKLSSDEVDKLSGRPITNTLSFEYYLRAKQEIYKFTEQSLNMAIDYLKKALSIEGENTLLYAELAHAHYQFWNFGIRIEEQDLKQANEYVQKVFALNKDSPHGHFVCGLLEITGGDAIKGISHFHKVLTEAPNHSDALAWLSAVYSFLGITTATEQLNTRLLQIDPFHTFGFIVPVMLDIFTGEFESAVIQARKSIKSSTEDMNLITCAFALMYNGQFEEAITILNNVSDSFQRTFVFRTCLLRKYAYQNEQVEFEQLIDDEFKLWAKKDFTYSLWLAEAYAMINDKKKTLNCLEDAVDRGFINYPFLNEYSPFLKNIRGEERFKKLMKRVKKEWGNFEV